MAKEQLKNSSRVSDLRKENPLILSELAKMLPGPPSQKSVYLWCRLGRTSASGRRVFMESIRLTKGRASSVDAYWRFIEALNR